MAFLKRAIKEMAAGGSTGAGAIAAYPGGLFRGGVMWSRDKKTHKRKRKNQQHSIFPHLQEALGIHSGKTKFNAADVVSRLDSAQIKNKAHDDTTMFGMEDDKGNLVKVYVRKDQSDQFEHTLAAMLGSADENADDRNSSLEIAEVLYDLKDKFDIVDVDWGQIQGDENEEQEVEPDEDEMTAQEQQPEQGENSDQQGQEQMPEQQPGLEGGEGDDQDVKSLLTQVIDVLKKQAEASQAEAEARTAEARAKEAEFTQKAAEAKVKQEEQVLDMEDYYNDKKDQDKEAKTLAKLAKFKHDKAKEAGAALKGGSNIDIDVEPEEEEERVSVTPKQLASLIFKTLRK